MTTLSSGLLTRAEAASYLGLKEQTLAAWATAGRYDLPFCKCGRLVRYRKSDIDAFLDRRCITHTGEAAGV